MKPWQENGALEWCALARKAPVRKAPVRRNADVLVVGAGPAGLALAAHLGEVGLNVLGVAPKPRAPWPNTYGVWHDEVAPLGYAAYLSHLWPDTSAHFGQDEVKLNRTYGRFDNAALQRHFWQRAEHGGVEWVEDVAARVEHGERGSRLHTQGGRTYTAPLVIDASGHTSKLVTRPPGALAFQTAFGILGRFSEPPVAPGQMLLMDFRDSFLTPEERRTPTFLYAMDLGEGLYLAEETSLAHRPGLRMDVLEDRLERRLASRGVGVLERVGLEHVRFPMNQPLPDLSGRVVGFGGAGSMVHPASGYMVASALRRAPELASVIAASLGAPGASPQETAEAAWGALWPRARVRQRQLYLFGLESLMTLDSAQTQAFFSAFFKLSPRLWQGYLSGTLPVTGVLKTMLGMFGHAPNSVRWPLTRAALTQPLQRSKL